MKKIPNAVLLLALLLFTATSARAQQWSQGDVSAQEQYAVVQINAFRANPTGYQAHYINHYASDPIVAGLIYYFYTTSPTGVAAAARGSAYNPSVAATLWVTSQVNTASPMPPLAIYPLFSQEAAASREGPQQLASGTQTATFAISSTTLNYTNPSAYNPPASIATVPVSVYQPISGGTSFSGSNATGGSASASVAAGTIGYFAVNGLLYDTTYVGPREWGLSYFKNVQTIVGGFGQVPETSIVNGNHLRMLGVNLAQRTASPGSGQTYLSTFYMDNERLTTSDLPYGPANTCFVTGVAYVDQNNNGEYDPGEGVSGLKVSINGSSWYAVTASAGGYSIPVQVGAGTLTVTATGTVSGATVTTTKTVTVVGDNVEVDFQYPSVRPAQVPVAAASGTAQIINLSTRGWTAPGAGVLTGGFVIGGAADVHKTVLIRGVAASLARFGIGGLLKPLLIVYNSAGVAIATVTTQQTFANTALAAVFSQVGAFPFSGLPYGGTTGGDTAVVLTLGVGAYTFTISEAPDAPALNASGASNLSGIVLAEVYDVSRSDGGRLINISTRGTAMSGQNQMIVGVVVGGSGTERLLVRAVGPTLATFGVANVLSNPSLVFDTSTGAALATNAGWDYGAQGLQIAALESQTGAFALPDPSLDAAAIVLVGPGSYTAPVSASTQNLTNTGIALVEIYEANSP